MARIRVFARRLASRFREGDAHGFAQVSIGQEAIAAGPGAAGSSPEPCSISTVRQSATER